MRDESTPDIDTENQFELPPALEEPGRQAIELPVQKTIDLALVEQTEEYWTQRSLGDRRHYIDQIDMIYDAIVKEFFQQANLAVDGHREFSQSHVSGMITW